MAVCEERDIGSILDHLTLTDFQFLYFRVERHTQSGASRIAKGGGAGMIDRGFQHVAQFVFVLRRHDDHVGQRPQVGDVVQPLMGRPVLADDAGAVHRKRHRDVHDTDVVNHLVVRPL